MHAPAPKPMMQAESGDSKCCNTGLRDIGAAKQPGIHQSTDPKSPEPRKSRSSRNQKPKNPKSQLFLGTQLLRHPEKGKPRTPNRVTKPARHRHITRFTESPGSRRSRKSDNRRLETSRKYQIRGIRNIQKSRNPENSEMRKSAKPPKPGV